VRKKRHDEFARLAPMAHSFYAVVMANIVLSIGMLAAFALIWGAWRMWRRYGLSQKVWLMAAAALIIFANVAIWTVPDQQGRSLVNVDAK
jgi:drug/metabolite transporter superfamily protein YnfA